MNENIFLPFLFLFLCVLKIPIWDILYMLEMNDAEYVDILLYKTTFSKVSSSDEFWIDVFLATSLRP